MNKIIYILVFAFLLSNDCFAQRPRKLIGSYQFDTLYVNFVRGLNKTKVGLGNVNNTSDSLKPISVATQAALNLKQNSLGFTPYNATNPNGYISSITSGNVTTALGFTPYNATNPSGYISSITSQNVVTALGFTPYNATNPNGYISAVPAQTFASLTSKPTTLNGYGITDAYPLSGNPSSFLVAADITGKANLASPTFSGTVSGITKSMVGLGNVDNVSDANKPISSATQTALNLKLATNGDGSSLTGLTKTQVGLANVDNTSDALKPLSTATTNALALKQDALVSATNIKTINSVSVLGSGDISVVGTTVLWGRVTVSNATTTGQVLVDVTGLSVALVANAVYEFEADLMVSTSAVTTGTGYGVNFSAAGATVESQITGALTSTAVKNLRINALATAATPYLTTSGQTGGIIIKGTVATGANAGNFTIQHRKETSGTSTVFINSTLRVIRIL